MNINKLACKQVYGTYKAMSEESLKRPLVLDLLPLVVMFTCLHEDETGLSNVLQKSRSLNHISLQ